VTDKVDYVAFSGGADSVALSALPAAKFPGPAWINPKRPGDLAVCLPFASCLANGFVSGKCLSLLPLATKALCLAERERGQGDQFLGQHPLPCKSDDGALRIDDSQPTPRTVGLKADRPSGPIPFKQGRGSAEARRQVSDVFHRGPRPTRATHNGREAGSATALGQPAISIPIAAKPMRQKMIGNINGAARSLDFQFGQAHIRQAAHHWTRAQLQGCLLVDLASPLRIPKPDGLRSPHCNSNLIKNIPVRRLGRKGDLISVNVTVCRQEAQNVSLGLGVNVVEEGPIKRVSPSVRFGRSCSHISHYIRNGQPEQVCGAYFTLAQLRTASERQVALWPEPEEEPCAICAV